MRCDARRGWEVEIDLSDVGRWRVSCAVVSCDVMAKRRKGEKARRREGEKARRRGPGVYSVKLLREV
jgi:hypothetical protein